MLDEQAKKEVISMLRRLEREFEGKLRLGERIEIGDRFDDGTKIKFYKQQATDEIMIGQAFGL